MTKKALVTGASRGIGRAIAGRLASQGYDLYLTCLHSMDALTEYAHELTEAYEVKCLPFQGDREKRQRSLAQCLQLKYITCTKSFLIIEKIPAFSVP